MKSKREKKEKPADSAEKQVLKDAKKVSLQNIYTCTTIQNSAMQALGDASTKLKWAHGLAANLDQLPGPQHVFLQ